MADVKNVVKAIDICLGHGKCNDCPYCLSGKGYTTMNCRDYMMRDALALLKEQDKRINMKQRRIDQLCKQLTDLKHRFHEKTELVRCKDCEWWGAERLCENSDSPCFQNGCTHGNWYCADGERKEGR